MVIQKKFMRENVSNVIIFKTKFALKILKIQGRSYKLPLTFTLLNKGLNVSICVRIGFKIDTNINDYV